MKGDFSQIRFNRGKHYTSVLQQQGRVALDADANEQCAIDDYLRRTETNDVVGEYGAPIGDAGFAITIEQNEIFIGSGRFYVAGLLCENPIGLSYGSQPYLINPSPTDSALLNELAQQDGQSVIQVYLQVWQRLVTDLDDPCLREPALGQADTTVRLQTVWRVVAGLVQTGQLAKQVVLPPGFSHRPEKAVLGSTLARSLETAKTVQAIKPFAVATTQHPLEAATIPESSAQNLKATRFKSGSGTILSQTSATTSGQFFQSQAPAGANAPWACCPEMYSQSAPQSTGTLSAATTGGSVDCSCQPIASAGYQGLENQLYRIEIHEPGDESSATFKWSRENGSVVATIHSMSGSTIWVDSLGPDANLGFQANQWVEIADDTYLFGQTPNQAGTLYQIQFIDPAKLSITLTSTVIPVDTSRNARVRRWDQTGLSAGSSGLPLSANTWLALENGIQVNFSTGVYQTGDYWMIPARTATGQIEWPPCSSNGTSFQPPHSQRIYQAPLACIHWNIKNQTSHVEDCRPLFSPLTALTAPVTPHALHISSISWTNDDLTTLDQLVANGLTVTFDQAPTGPVNGANFIVTLEAATAPARTFDARILATTKAGDETLPSTILRGVTIVDTQISLSGTTLSWQLPYLQAGFPQRETILFLEELLSFGAPAHWFARVRVKALGRALFLGSGSGQLFLDGQSFGQSALRADGTTPRVDLQFPTGNGEKASDFESWFYLAPTLLIASITMNFTALTVVINSSNVVTGVVATPQAGGNPVPVTPQATVRVSYPAIADTPVSLALSVVPPGTTGVGTVANIPSTVTVSRNQTTAQIPVSILSNPGVDSTGKAIVLTFQITASLNSAVGPVGALSVSFSVTGVTPQVIIQ